MQTNPDARDRLRGCRILIVDDEFLIGSDLEFLFSDAGASVWLATTLPAALDAANSATFSAALLDVRLGNESSEPVAEVLAARGVPFLFFSGQQPPERVRAKFPGARLLLKPLGFGDLLSATADLVPC